jgi:argininosuccinate lyase
MNKKVWNTSGVKVSDEISSFLAGEDIELDNSIFIYDIDATIAHIKGLQSINILKKNEFNRLNKSLKDSNQSMF